MVMPVEYKSVTLLCANSENVTKLLNRADVLDKMVHSMDVTSTEMAHSIVGIIFFKIETLRIVHGLYIDESEIANPLGTSKKKQTVWYLLGSCQSSLKILLLSPLHSASNIMQSKCNQTAWLCSCPSPTSSRPGDS